MDYKYYYDMFSWPYRFEEPTGWDDMIEKKRIITRKNFVKFVHYKDMFKTLKMNGGRFNDFTKSTVNLNYCRFFSSWLYGQRIYGIMVSRNVYVFRWQPREKWKYLEPKRCWQNAVLI